MKTKKKSIIGLLSKLIEMVLAHKVIDCSYNISTPVKETPSDDQWAAFEHSGDYILDFHIHLFRKTK